jgi:hypothetical protein
MRVRELPRDLLVLCGYPGNAFPAIRPDRFVASTRCKPRNTLFAGPAGDDGELPRFVKGSQTLKPRAFRRNRTRACRPAVSFPA